MPTFKQLEEMVSNVRASACATNTSHKETIRMAQLFLKLAPLIEYWSDEAVQGPTMSKNDDEMFELWDQIKEQLKKPA